MILQDPWLVLAALMLEAALGYPLWLHRHVPHPVTGIGALIAGLDRQWNRDGAEPLRRRAAGILALLLIAGVAGGAGLVLSASVPAPARTLLVVVLATAGLAQRSLHDHVAAVLAPLRAGDFAAARTAVARIVGRDVHGLDTHGIAAAAVESLAESFSDGIVAPAFWLLLGGLPGLFIYKAVNTADSMIGHKEPRWRDFGWAAARSDDVLNFIPARLAGALVAAAGLRGWRTMMAEATKHASPNAGWPEAAMAGALNVRLGGAAAYDGRTHARPVFGAGPLPDASDLQRALHIYRRACALLWLLLAVGGLLWRR